MPTKDGFDPVHPLPLAFADEEIEQPDIANASDGVVFSRVFKASALIAAVTAAGIAVLAVGDPVTLYADVTTALFGNPEPQSAATDQSTPVIQSVADVPVSTQAAADPQILQPTGLQPTGLAPTASPPTANDVQPRDEVAAAEPVVREAPETRAPTSEELFRQFQAWAAQNDAQADVRQDAPVPIMKEPEEKAPVPHRLMQKQRRVAPVRNARAEARTDNGRQKVRRAPAPRAERSPAEDARTQGQSAQPAETRSFLTTFGQRN